MTNTKIYRRNLPHIHPHQGIFFITFRLYGTLPKNVLQMLLKNRKSRLLKIEASSRFDYILKKYRIKKRFFMEYDNWLDNTDNERAWLSNPKIADILCNIIKAMCHHYYDLIAFCIMPNHVHMLIKLRDSIQIKHKGKTKPTLLQMF